MAETDDWTRPAFLSEAHAWIEARLDEHSLEIMGELEQPHLQWWSTVLRVPTSGGDVFFKASRPDAAFEGPLTSLLAEVFPELVDVGPDGILGDPRRVDAAQVEHGPDHALRAERLLERPDELLTDARRRVGAERLDDHRVGLAERRQRRVDQQECFDALGGCRGLEHRERAAHRVPAEDDRTAP